MSQANQRMLQIRKHEHQEELNNKYHALNTCCISWTAQLSLLCWTFIESFSSLTSSDSNCSQKLHTIIYIKITHYNNYIQRLLLLTELLCTLSMQRPLQVYGHSHNRNTSYTNPNSIPFPNHTNAVCLQIQPNKFPDFQDTFNKVPAGFFYIERAF